MSEREQDRKDMFQIAGDSIKPATEFVVAGASGIKDTTGNIFGMIFRRKASRLLQKFNNYRVMRRMR